MKLDPATTQKWLEKLTESFEKAPQKLKDAPSFKKMVDSFTKSAAENKGGGKEWGDFFTKLGQSWSGKSPSVPKAGGDWKWPSLKDPPAAAPSAPSLPSSPPVPALGAAALPAVGSVAGFVGLLALLGLAALVVVGVWVLYGRRVRDWLDRRRGVELDAVVDPEDVTTSAALVRAFERLTLDQCGERARPWNHRRIALRLGGEDPRRREAARALADLYAVARYAPRNELPPEQLADARRHLSLLTGVTPA
jgi:hypothetical protein